MVLCVESSFPILKDNQCLQGLSNLFSSVARRNLVSLWGFSHYYKGGAEFASLSREKLALEASSEFLEFHLILQLSSEFAVRKSLYSTSHFLSNYEIMRYLLQTRSGRDRALSVSAEDTE